MSTVDNSQILGSKTGPQLVSEIATQIGNADTELDARPKAAVNETVTGNWTFTGIEVSQLPTGGGLGWRFLMGDVEAAHTTAHEIEWRGNAAGTEIALTPKIDGVPTTGKELFFDFILERWNIETDLNLGGNITGGAQTLDLNPFEWGGDTIWHAGNFVPSSKAAAVHSHNLNDGSDVNTAGLVNGYIMQWNATTNKWIMVVKPSGAGSTNISISMASSAITVKSDTGTDGSIPAATATKAGCFTAAQKVAHDDVVAKAIKDGDFTVNGIMVRTASGGYTNRTMIGTGGIKVTNGDGVSANPQFSLDTGSNADKVDGFHLSKLTQAAYDALTPNGNTVYFIVG